MPNNPGAGGEGGALVPALTPEEIKAAKKAKAKKLMMMTAEEREAHESLDELTAELLALKTLDPKKIAAKEKVVAAKKEQLDAAKKKKDKEAEKDIKEALKEAEAELKEVSTIDAKAVKAKTKEVEKAEKEVARLDKLKLLDEARKLAMLFLKYQQTPWTLAPLPKGVMDEAQRKTELEAIAEKRVEAAKEALELAYHPSHEKIIEAQRVVEEKQLELAQANLPPQEAIDKIADAKANVEAKQKELAEAQDPSQEPIAEAQKVLEEAKAAEEAAKAAAKAAKASPDAKRKEGK